MARTEPTPPVGWVERPRTYHEQEDSWAAFHFEELRCSDCDCCVGYYLDTDAEGLYDVGRFAIFWRGPTGQLFCEDCAPVVIVY